MTKKHLQNIIKFDDKRLIPISHCYARDMARWLEILVSYVGRSNLTMIMSEMILK